MAFSLRESKAHIAMDIFTFIKKTLMKEYVQAVLNPKVLNASALSYILICCFCRSVSFNDTVYYKQLKITDKIIIA